jgi:hypothetical protein
MDECVYGCTDGVMRGRNQGLQTAVDMRCDGLARLLAGLDCREQAYGKALCWLTQSSRSQGGVEVVECDRGER